ncbi:unnamed protein product [Cuscuta campestris]|uniref:Retrotransposon gag domain-containing protein n=1 Tax=Cuscuta campestris TaxID=132261 RepID=A0A484KM47_9ASTE|nr:unnamed protein product [Cuscuta campestris]
MGFLDGTTVASSTDDVEWYQFDALLQGWILSTVSDEVSDLVLANNPSAHALWKAIYKLFHDNKHARAMQLEHRFRTTVKGNRSIKEYCHRLKNLADYLDDVDAPVTEHALVLQVLQGLSQDIRGQVHFLQYQNPFPSFLEVRLALLLVEQQQADTFSGAGSSTALISTGSGSSQPAGSGHPRQTGGGGMQGAGRAPMAVKTRAATAGIVDADVDVDQTNDNLSAQTRGSSPPPHPASWAHGPHTTQTRTQPRPIIPNTRTHHPTPITHPHHPAQTHTHPATRKPPSPTTRNPQHPPTHTQPHTRHPPHPPPLPMGLKPSP